MSCMFGNGTCNCCENFTKTTSVSLSDKKIVLAIDTTVLNNGTMLCIQIAQDIPDISTLNYVPNIVIQVPSLGIFTVIQDVTYGLCGVPNNLYADQLAKIKCGCNETFKPNQILSVKFATDTQCFNYVGCRKPLCQSKGVNEFSSSD